MHFPETSFMNYTRSKLTKTTSVPTIYFNAEDVEIDLLNQPTDWVIENKKNRPSIGFLAGLNTSTTASKIKLDIDESSNQMTILNASEASPSIKKEGLKRPRAVIVSTPKQEVRILNKLPTTTATTLSVNNQVHTLEDLKQIIKKSPQNQLQATKKILSPPEKVRIISSSSSSSPKIIKQEILNQAPTVTAEDQFEVMYFDESSPAKPAADYSKEFMSVKNELAEIKTMLNEKLKPVQSSTSVTSDSSNITQSYFNKIQLFNGIKRYLSPSLIALLRMEIFAAPNREYKKDEKIICSEILKLGTDAYDFFSDEWRLRLPSKDVVKNWLSEEMTDDDAS